MEKLVQPILYWCVHEEKDLALIKLEKLAYSFLFFLQLSNVFFNSTM